MSQAETAEVVAPNNAVPGAPMRDKATPAHKPRQGPARGRLTDRDRQLFGLLAAVRCLTTEQVGRLMFPGRHPETGRKRLLALAGEGAAGFETPYLSRQQYRTFEGKLVATWRLTPVGYLVAEGVLDEPVKVPRTDVSADFLEHAVALNDLFVDLLARPLDAELVLAKAAVANSKNPARELARRKETTYARARGRRFRWSAADTVRLPWSEYDMTAGQTRERLIQPDAVLELPELRRRFFLECEMGTHTIQAVSDDKPGATISKVERYSEFVNGMADPRARQTFYSKVYADGFKPELLFLVRSDSRARSIKKALEQCTKGPGDTRVPVRALTFDEAVAEFLPLVSATSRSRADLLASRSAAGPTGLTADEIGLLRNFYSSMLAVVKTVRAEARAKRATPPPYPRETQPVYELLERLLAQRPTT